MEPSGWEKAKRVIDLVAGLSVIATMIFIALQWSEMHAGGVDTHDLAISAKSQADAAKSQADTTRTIADAAKSQADNTKSLALAAAEQVKTLAAGVNETHALVKATQDTLSAMRRNFINEQRPYIWPRADPVVFEKGKPLDWNVHFVNYGKSPGINVRICTTLTYGGDAMPTASTQTEEGMIEQCKKSSFQATSIAPPGDTIFSTAQSAGIIADDATVSFLRDTDLRVVLRAIVSYDDVAGNHYKSLFCGAHLASGAIYTCQTGNEIK